MCFRVNKFQFKISLPFLTNLFSSWFTHNVDVRVKDLDLSLSMSTVIGLGDLAEDEIIPKPLPVEILLQNIKINIIEDRPPINITSPGAVPINLSIGKMIILRDENGIFNIQPDVKIKEESVIERKEKDRDRELLSFQLVMQQMKLDNESLRKQLNLSEKNADASRLKLKQENDILRTYLKGAQDDISSLLDEKKTLLDTVKSLQVCV